MLYLASNNIFNAIIAIVNNCCNPVIDLVWADRSYQESGCNALNLGVEFFLCFTHQIQALLSFLFPFRSFFPISKQYSDWCLCHV
jgi:hypothetical protein